MAVKQVAIRLATDGGAEVKRAFTEVRGDGVAAFAAIGAAAEASGQKQAQAADTAAARQQASWARQAAAAKAAMVAQATQNDVNSLLGVNRDSGWSQKLRRDMEEQANARHLAAQAVREQAAAEAEFEARARALIGTIDPLFAAQERYNASVREAQALMFAGKLSAEQYDMALGAAKAQLDQSTAAVQRHGAAVQRSGANTAMMGQQIQDIGIQLAMGTNPFMVMAMQAGQLAYAMQGTQGKLGAFVSFLGGPWGSALLAGASVLAILVPKLLETEDATKKASSAQEVLADVFDRTTGRIKEQISATDTLIAKLRLKKLEETNAETAREGRRSFASALETFAYRNPITELRDADAIRRQTTLLPLAQTLKYTTDPQQLATTLSALDAAAKTDKKVRDFLVKNADALKAQRDAVAEMNRAAAAQRLLAGDRSEATLRAAGQYDARGRAEEIASELTAGRGGRAGEEARNRARVKELQDKLAAGPGAGGIGEAEFRRLAAAEADRHEAAMKRYDGATKAAERRAEALRRESSAMGASADGALALAQAYLEGGDAALVAEARRKALTDATRRGYDVDARVREQLAIAVNEATVAGAKAVAGTRDEIAARDAVTAKVRDGTLAADDAAEAIQRETALRPLMRLQAIAQGEALAMVTRVIREQTKAWDDNAASRAAAAAAAAKAANDQRGADIALQRLFVGRDDDASQDDLVRRRAEADADRQKFTGADRRSFITSTVGVARDERELQRAQAADRILKDQGEALQLARAELSTVGMTAAEREREMMVQRLILDLQREKIGATSDEGRAIIANAIALDDQARAMEATIAQQRELTDLGLSAVDAFGRVLSPDGWMKWGDAGKAILRDILAEAQRMVLLNPLKAWLFGGNAQSGFGGGGLLKGLIGAVAGAFGGGFNASSVVSSANAAMANFKPFARGTDYAPGGLALVGEEGPELMHVPRGARITTADRTRELLRGGGSTVNAPVTFHIDARGAGPREVDVLTARMAQMEATLPQRIVATTQDALSRRLIKVAA